MTANALFFPGCPDEQTEETQRAHLETDSCAGALECEMSTLPAVRNVNGPSALRGGYHRTDWTMDKRTVQVGCGNVGSTPAGRSTLRVRVCTHAYTHTDTSPPFHARVKRPIYRGQAEASSCDTTGRQEGEFEEDDAVELTTEVDDGVGRPTRNWEEKV